MCNKAVVDLSIGGESTELQGSSKRPGFRAGRRRMRVCPLELSLKPVLKAASSGATKPMHGNYSSAGKASASLCLAAYSGEHLPLVHGDSRSGTVSHKEAKVKAERACHRGTRAKRKKEEKTDHGTGEQSRNIPDCDRIKRHRHQKASRRQNP